jgi:hypothetical protein
VQQVANKRKVISFSDVFEEQGVVKQPFYSGFGLIAAGGIPSLRIMPSKCSTAWAINASKTATET